MNEQIEQRSNTQVYYWKTKRFTDPVRKQWGPPSSTAFWNVHMSKRLYIWNTGTGGKKWKNRCRIQNSFLFEKGGPKRFKMHYQMSVLWSYHRRHPPLFHPVLPTFILFSQNAPKFVLYLYKSVVRFELRTVLLQKLTPIMLPSETYQIVEGWSSCKVIYVYPVNYIGEQSEI